MAERSVPTSEKLSHFTSIKFGFSTRNGGVSPVPLGMNLSFNVGDDKVNVVHNRRLFFGALGISSQQVAVPLQCHSATVHIASQPGEYTECDGLLTSVPQVALAISVADCVPIFIFDPHKSVVAAVHSGWKGTVRRIVTNAIGRMIGEYGSQPTDLVAFIGPSAGVCCYEVGSEVAMQMDPSVVQNKDGKTFVNLKHANKNHLTEMGVVENNIEVSSYCTICSPELFHSYRRDRNASGRMMGVIMIH
ncbi:MAG: peptidoglycan editing factor PgeF [Ignavibacteriales bacterium]|nr:peptidoglycan editing factor PgeF [Ignavibacteriales bacterium]